MILNALILFHVVLSLIGIVAGFAVVRGLLFSDPPYRGTTLFVATTAATSMTGFFFPFHGFTPGQAVGILSLIVLLIAGLDAYRYSLAGGWRRTFAITTVIALDFNVFIFVIQLFRKGACASRYRADAVRAAVTSDTVACNSDIRGNRYSRCYENESRCG